LWLLQAAVVVVECMLQAAAVRVDTFTPQHNLFLEVFQFKWVVVEKVEKHFLLNLFRIQLQQSETLDLMAEILFLVL
jgi:hypothetical protein